MIVALLFACTDYELTGGKPAAGGRRRQDDSASEDGAFDTAADDGEDTGGGAIPDETDTSSEPCTSTKTVRIGVTADDWWEGWLAGQHFGEQEHWWETTWTELEVPCGEHVLAIYATDLHQAISGFIGQVEIDGVVVAQSGDGQFLVHAGQPEGEWQRASYDDSAWGVGQGCNYADATGWWGSSPTDLVSAGAWWIWPNDCLSLGDAAFRLPISVQ